MNEIYWITRLDGLNTLFMIITIISVSAVSISLFIYIFTKNDKYEEDTNKTAKFVLKTFLPIMIVSSLLLIFIPTKKDMLLIWGVGGTIDYIKSNETIKQLPDKCVKALDSFIEEYIPEDVEENSK